MKTFRFLVIAAAAAIALASCEKREQAPDDRNNGAGAITLSISTDEASTKAASVNNESALTDVQVIMFNSSNELYKYYSLTADEISAKSCKFEGIKTGTYAIYVIANGPDFSKLQNRTDLIETVIMLGDYNNPSSDFIMSGLNEKVTVTSEQDTQLDMTITRYVSRVTISQIKNNLPEGYGDMTVNYAVLSNVIGKQIIQGTYGYNVFSTSYFYNKDCRCDENPRVKEHIIGTPTGTGTDKYKASFEDDTFIDYSQVVSHGDTIKTPKYLYGYPNSMIQEGSGFEDPFTQKATSIDLSVSFKVKGTNHTYYYNIPLQGKTGALGILRNYDYDVKITISAEGEDEPGKHSDRGTLYTNITIKTDWNDGQSIDIDFQ